MKNEFYFLSRDQRTQIHAVEWIPDGEVRAVVQICHGMVEYIDRYHDFAQYLSERGYYVIGNDHLGHGRSVCSESEYGFFGSKNGNKFVIGDIHKLRTKTADKYPDVPYFMLGHSMGSFLLRQYLQMHGRGLQGAVIMGTGDKPPIVLMAGKVLCRVLMLVKGEHYRSKLVDHMATGSYNKHFYPSRTGSDWLTKDTKIVDEYVKSPYCTFVFTVNAFYHMFCGMLELTKKDNMNRIPKKLPLFFVAGEQDPVGGFGKDVDKVYNRYKNCGIKDVTLKLYPDDRHEILNETDRDQVYSDIFEWLEVHRKR